MEQREEENSPQGAPVAADGPDGETDVQGGVQRVQERPTGVVETNVLRRDTGPGGRPELQEASRGIEVDSDGQDIVKGAGHNGIGRGRDGSGDDIDTNTPGRVIRPGGQLGEQEAMGDIERDWRRQDVVGGGRCDGSKGGKGGATSAARRDPKRLETEGLAEYQASQHEPEQRQRTTTNVPGSSTPPPNHPRRPHSHPNPPHRRGRLKTRPTTSRLSGFYGKVL